MSPWTSRPWSVMLYGFTERGCRRRRILMTCRTSWTSPFSRSLNLNPMTPSLTYSTRPSLEDFGLSSLTSAVKRQVAPVDRSCLHRPNSRARRSASFGESRLSRLTESTATLAAPDFRMNSGSSLLIRVIVVFASAGSSFTMWSVLSFTYRLRAQPQGAALVREDARELLDVHVPLAVARTGVALPFEREASVHGVHEHLLVLPFEDAAGEKEIDEPVPPLRDAPP